MSSTALHEALEQVAARDPIKAKLVEMRFFAGLTLEQAAEVMTAHMAVSTIERSRSALRSGCLPTWSCARDNLIAALWQSSRELQTWRSATPWIHIWIAIPRSGNSPS